MNRDNSAEPISNDILQVVHQLNFGFHPVLSVLSIHVKLLNPLYSKEVFPDNLRHNLFIGVHKCDGAYSIKQLPQMPEHLRRKTMVLHLLF